MPTACTAELGSPTHGALKLLASRAAAVDPEEAEVHGL